MKHPVLLLAGIVCLCCTLFGCGNNHNRTDSNDTMQVNGKTPELTFTDQDGTVYIAAFLKDMTDSALTIDVIEFISDDNTERIKELNLTEEDMPDGYYIYNADEETVTWKLDGETIYTFIDWNGNFTDSDYPEEYTTKNVAEFQKYISTYEHSQPGMPFFFQIKEGKVKVVLEKWFA